MSTTSKIPDQYLCDFCAASVSVRELTRVGPETFYCDECSTKVPCDSCGTVLSVGKHQLSEAEIRCRECRRREADDGFDIQSFAKQGAIAVVTLLIVVLLRSLDVLLPRLIRVSDEVMHFRPFGPVIAVYESGGGELVLLVGAIAVAVFLANAWLPIGLLDLVTFPGTVVHEWAHLNACRYYGLQVYDVVYFQLDGNLGYVRHEVPNNPMKHLAVSAAPFVVNTGIALGIATVTTVTLRYIGDIAYVVSLWLAFSIGVCAIPSYLDADNVWDRVVAEWAENPVILLALPVLLLIYTVNVLRIAFVGVLYGLCLVFVGVYSGTLLV